MLPHQERVVAEKEELDAKLFKLVQFKSTETFAKLPQIEQERLIVQVQVMRLYSDILRTRINAFNDV